MGAMISIAVLQRHASAHPSAWSNDSIVVAFLHRFYVFFIVDIPVADLLAAPSSWILDSPTNYTRILAGLRNRKSNERAAPRPVEMVNSYL
ncbi:hypothetical protein EYZ11_012429 [Aspergillus tanneri]|uniref:Uncharacterized protein n=1 Tax=Aspergillus tanneri TaxID=1220188 RepID=A0A4S3J5P1_9EURO|nr:hypothetical protein EYZ11_012429 [Aspergillus tanneri]